MKCHMSLRPKILSSSLILSGVYVNIHEWNDYAVKHVDSESWLNAIHLLAPVIDRYT